MSKHEQYEELCTLAMIGEVSPDEMQDLRRHLGECSACREQYREFIEFLLPQLSLASDDTSLASGYTEAERKQLRREFLSRAEARGMGLSGDALEGEEKIQVHSLPPATRAPRLLWQGALAASLAGLLFGGGYWTHRSLATNSNASRTVSPSQPGAQQPAAFSIRPPDNHTDSALEQKLTDTMAHLEDAQRALAQSEAGQSTLESQLEQKNKQITALEAEVQGDAQASADLRAQAADLKRRMDENQSALAANELRIRDLNEQLGTQTASLDREREMLTVGRDVRDLMGARSLHIIDVHDANGAGKNQKSFGRIFYTEGKSLIFYAFDLDDKRVVNANYSYQAWGERLGQPASVKSLGMLYVDDKAERRWSLKVDDPHQLSEINSIFVTLEPRSGDGDKPRGKRILFAFLGGEANHP